MKFSRSGLTLIELLITLGLISVLIVAVTFVSLVVLRSWQADSSHSSLRLQTSDAVERLSKELRNALGIVRVQDKEISIWLDLNDNGLEEAASEQISFSWSGVSGESLYRTEGSGLSQEILSNVSRFLITCFDQNNNSLAYPITDTSAIRLIQIQLTSNIDEEVINYRFNVKVRNL